MALAAKLELLDADGRRGARQRVRLDGSLGGEGAGGSDVIVHDLSSSGFMFATDQELAIGAHVDLDLAGLGQAAARVVWRHGPCCGCEFSRPLDAEEVAAALQAARVVWGNFGGDDVKSQPVAEPVQIAAPGAGRELEAEIEGGIWPLWGRIFFIGSSAAGLWLAILAAGSMLIRTV